MTTFHYIVIGVIVLLLTIIVSLMIVIFFLKKSARRTNRHCNPPLNAENRYEATYREMLLLPENEVSYQPLRMHQDPRVRKNHPTLPTKITTQDATVRQDTEPYQNVADLRVYENNPILPTKLKLKLKIEM